MSRVYGSENYSVLACYLFVASSGGSKAKIFAISYVNSPEFFI